MSLACCWGHYFCDTPAKVSQLAHAGVDSFLYIKEQNLAYNRSHENVSETVPSIHKQNDDIGIYKTLPFQFVSCTNSHATIALQHTYNIKLSKLHLEWSWKYSQWTSHDMDAETAILNQPVYPALQHHSSGPTEMTGCQKPTVRGLPQN